MTTDRIKRAKEIAKAIKEVGLLAVLNRIKTPEDKEILDEILQGIEVKMRDQEDKALKRAGISF